MIGTGESQIKEARSGLGYGTHGDYRAFRPFNEHAAPRPAAPGEGRRRGSALVRPATPQRPWGQ